MKILYVSEFFFPRVGGGENWLRQIAREMVVRGHEVHVVTSRLPGTREQEIIDGIRIHRPFSSGNFAQRLLFMHRLRSYLKTFIREHSIDVIHSNAYIPTPASSAAGKACGVRVITSVHLGLGKKWFQVTNPLSALINWTFEGLIVRASHHDVLHVTAEETKRRFIKNTNAPVVVIYNFLDEDVFRQGSKTLTPTSVRKKYAVKGKLLLSVGSLLPVKNLREAVRWTQSLDEPITLLIAGSGPERTALEKLARKQTKAHIKLIGKIDDEQKLQLLGACDAFILISKSEQFPLTVLEALALSRPVIATPVGGIPDIAKAGFSKEIRFVKTQADFAAAVRRLTRSKPKLNERLLRTYSRSGVIDDFLAIYGADQKPKRSRATRRAKK